MPTLEQPLTSGQWTVFPRSLVGRLAGREVLVTAPGALLAAVARACDGHTPWREVVARLATRWPRARVDAFLQALADEGLLQEGHRAPPEAATFDDRALDAACLLHFASVLPREAEGCRVAVLRPLEGLGPGLYEAGAGLRRLDADPADSWRLLADPRVLRFASAVLLPVVRARGEEALRRAWFTAGRAFERLQPLLARHGAAAVFRTDVLQAPTPFAVVVGAAPTREQSLRQSADHWLRVQPLPGPGFAWAAGPIPSGHGALHASGRGADPQLAVRKAEAEAWERLGWARLGAVQAGSIGQLPGALDPTCCIAYDAFQHAQAGFPFAPFSRRRRYLWKAGVDTRTGATVWLPADCLVARSALAAPPARRALTSASTSGVAAWTDREGALCRAVLELLERDAVLRAWLPGQPIAQLDPATLPSHLSARALALQASGHRVGMAAIGQGLVPVYSVFVQHAGLPFTALTAAAAFDAEEALSKALDEAEGRAAHAAAFPARTIRSPREVRSVQDVVHLFRGRRWFRASDFYAAGPRTQAFGPAHTACADWPQLQDRLHVLAFDLTPPGAALDQGRTPLHVVRAVVPGLLLIWFGHGLEPAGL
ncbi:MAG TPA: YcaO-like family protein, partial [Ramlibacter sp.]|nr:YcaO-like family protein [Ramlibacter sp.]